MQTGSKVRLKPTSEASGELRQKVAALGDVVGEVGAMTGIGVCTVLLPPGISIPGHSHPLGDGRDYIDLHKEHLEAA